MKKIRSELSAKAIAKVEASAKFSVQRKKLTTEIIPPDVTRAKADRWLDLISPITEWAGLKGDRLKYQRQQLRVHREASLEALGKRIRLKTAGNPPKHKLSPRIFVPALEAASLEDAESPFIDWWANLLVTGSVSGELRPYLVQLMRLIGPQEAQFLDKLWGSVSLKDQYESRRRDVRNEIYRSVFSELDVILQAQDPKQDAYWEPHVEKKIQELMRKVFAGIDKLGTYLQVAIELGPNGNELQSIAFHGESFPRASFPAGKKSRNLKVIVQANLPSGQVPIDVVRGLTVVKIETASQLVRNHNCEIRILQLTDLGAEFMRACRP